MVEPLKISHEDLERAMQALINLSLAEAYDPKSWHWIIDKRTGFFKHKHQPKNREIQHIRFVREKLSPEKELLLDEALRVLAAAWREIKQDDCQKAVRAIDVFLGENGVRRTDQGFHVPDLPLDAYTERSDENLQFPQIVSFGLSQGGVVQSAREAVVLCLANMHDLMYGYLTRTAAIYYRKNDRILVAFDDDPFDNILLTATKEGYDAGGEWFVDIGRVAAAIARAEKAGRVIGVTIENKRPDPLEFGRCILGDKTEQYDHFLQHHLGRKLRGQALSSSFGVSETRVLIRCVRIGNSYVDDLIASCDLSDGSRARWVQKISAGNGDPLLPYMGLLLFKDLGLYRGESDAAALLSFFEPLERQFKPELRRWFYGGLGIVRPMIKSTKDIEQFAAFFKQYGHHTEWFKRPILLRYAFEVFLHDQAHPTGLLDRLRSRRDEKFKLAFLRRAYEQRFHYAITDEELLTLPSSSLMKMIECDTGNGYDHYAITAETVHHIHEVIKTTKKGAHFPLNKVYYRQSAKGVKIERMALEVVRQAVLDIISITATPVSRWQQRHDEAKQRVAAVLNNPAKADDLINFFRSCIDQGNYFKQISKEFTALKAGADKAIIVNALQAIKMAARSSKHERVADQLYEEKMEPLNDILTMLKAQTDDTASEVQGVIIKTQTPSITDLVDYDTVHCCALYPYDNDEGIDGYMEDEHIILLQYFTTGKRGLLTIYGVIICALCEDENGNNVLLVDSAEGDENWLKAMRHWEETYRDCIKKLAKDSGCVGVFYGKNAGNTVPKKFLNHLSGELSVTTMALRKKNPAGRYLESFRLGSSGTPEGYYEPV